MKYLYNIVAIASTIAIVGCSGGSNKGGGSDFEVSVKPEHKKSLNGSKKESNEDVVFYNMFSPVDLSRVIDQNSSYFNSAYISSLNNITKYNTSHKMALNIGVYGADLTYLWMFDQNQQALSYLAAIQHLTSKIGIPDNFVEFTVETAENSSQNLDTLVEIAREAYYNTDKYLKGSDRDNAAVLILMGGWVETLYITLNMYTQVDSRQAGKILTQKYSLASLINMVQNSQDDIIMSEYLLLMKKLNSEFAVLESLLKPEDVDIDTVKKRISVKPSSSIRIEPEQFDGVKNITEQIRKHIIS